MSNEKNKTKMYIMTKSDSIELLKKLPILSSYSVPNGRVSIYKHTSLGKEQPEEKGHTIGMLLEARQPYSQQLDTVDRHDSLFPNH
jgi:hypothetical protein